MSETTMPATEAAVDTTDEVVSYELAFHVLPTVAEGEVTRVVEAITAHITHAGGTIGLAEAPQRMDLAYELQKMIDGKYRRFATAYFGWVRFTAKPAAIAAILDEVEALPEVLRAMVVRLTRQEEEHPFYLHETLASRQQVTDIDVSSAIAEAEADASTESDDSATDEADETADTDVSDDSDTASAENDETPTTTPAEAPAETKEDTSDEDDDAAKA